jgi:tetratricopeptide (TPR) repeat protein
MPEPSRPTLSIREEVTRTLGERATAATTSPTPEPPVPARLGRYEVRRVLGQGGMGTVYAARDPQLQRDVALKLLRRRGKAFLDTEGHQALLREARAAAAISHPHVVTIYDVGELEGEPFISMELVEGPSLRRLMRERGVGSPQVLRALQQAARGLAAAHARGLVHRDFKPSNVMVRANGEAVVLDFGLATASRGAGVKASAELDAALGTEEDEVRTSNGFIVGTPAYMAPEQHLGEAVDARADQFALCVSLYEALYGRRPFPSKDLALLRAEARSGEIPEPPSDASRLARRLWPVIARGLAPDPAHRWPSITALLAELEHVGAPARGRHLAVFGLGAAAVVLAVLSLMPASDSCSGAAQRLATVWNDDVRSRARATMLAIPVAHAEHTWPRVESGLDELGTAWVDTSVSVCRALGPEAFAAAEDPQVQCLDRRLAELRAFVSLLEQPDPAVLERVVMALPDRTAINTCETLERTEPPLPTDQAAVVASAQQELDEIMVWLQADRIDDVLARTRTLRATVEGIDHPPLQARIHFVLGEALLHHHEPDAAGAELEAGYELALGHDDALAAKLAARLVYLRGYMQTRLDEGRTWRRHAEAALERVPYDPLATAYVERQVAVLLDASGEPLAALERLEHALGRLEAHYGPVHVRLLPVLSSLAVVQQRLGRLEAAVATHERTLAIKRAELGDDHPSIVSTLSNLAIALSDLDRLEEALAMATEVLERKRANPSIDSQELAGTESTLGVILDRQGRKSEAQAAFERACEDWHAWTEERHPDAAVALMNLGKLAELRHDLAMAERAHARGLALLEALLGPDHPRLAESLTNLASVRRKTGAREDAIALLERAVALLEHSQASPFARWATDFELAQALWEQGLDRERALLLAERSRRARAKAGEEFQRTEDLAGIDAWLSPRRSTLLASPPPAP